MELKDWYKDKALECKALFDSARTKKDKNMYLAWYTHFLNKLEALTFTI